MRVVTLDRSLPTRRNGRDGGRRRADQPGSSTVAPSCPRCRGGSPILAGEAEGGWWFVCDACDHLWDQRTLVNCRMSPRDNATDVTAPSESRSGSWLSNVTSSWRVALGRSG